MWLTHLNVLLVYILQVVSAVHNPCHHIDCTVSAKRLHCECVLHCAGARSVLELVDGAVVNGLLEQISPLFHLNHIRRHRAYTVGIAYNSLYTICDNFSTVQLTAPKDLSPKWPVVCQMECYNSSHSRENLQNLLDYVVKVVSVKCVINIENGFLQPMEFRAKAWNFHFTLELLLIVLKWWLDY